MAFKIKELKTLQVDTEKGICLVNGEDISSTGKYLKLEFENGEWSLVITEDRYFASPATEQSPHST